MLWSFWERPVQLQRNAARVVSAFFGITPPSSLKDIYVGLYVVIKQGNLIFIYVLSYLGLEQKIKLHIK